MTTGNEPGLSKQQPTTGNEPQLTGEAAFIHAVEVLREGDAQSQARALQFLGNVKDHRITQKLVEMLPTADRRLSRRIIELLGKSGDPHVAPALVDYLQSEDWTVRRETIQALGNLPSETSTQALLNALENEDDDPGGYAPGNLRALAARALIPLVGPEHSTRLEAIFNAGLSIHVRWGVAECLLRTGVELTADQVTQVAVPGFGLFHYWNHFQLLSEVILKALREREDVRIWWKQHVYHCIHSILPIGVALLKEADPQLREWGCRWLGIGQQTAALPDLIPMIFDPVAAVRYSAAHALGQIKKADAAEALQSALTDADPKVRCEAALALGRINAPSAVPALIRLLSDDSAKVRWTAAKALGMIGSHTATPALLNALSDAHHNVRLQAIIALGKTGDPAAFEPLVGLLDAPQRDFRYHALRGLGKVGGSAALPHLHQTLNSPELPLRHAALIALLDIQTEEVDDLIIAALHDASFAAPSIPGQLFKLGERGIPFLIEALHNPNQRFAQRASWKLNSFTNYKMERIPDAAFLLRRGLTSEQAHTRLYSLVILMWKDIRCGPEEYELVIRLLDDPVEEIQLRAARALEYVQDEQIQAALQAWRQRRGETP